LCAVRILKYLKLSNGDTRKILDTLLPTMNADVEVYQETAADIVDLLSEWSLSIRKSLSLDDESESLEQRAKEIFGAVSECRRRLKDSLAEEERAWDGTFKPELLISALLRVRMQDDADDELLRRVMQQISFSEEKASASLPPKIAIRAIGLCNQMIVSDHTLTPQSRDVVLDTLIQLLRIPSGRLESDRLIQLWNNLLRSSINDISRHEINAAKDKLARTMP
jgi:hypothetical protein